MNTNCKNGILWLFTCLFVLIMLIPVTAVAETDVTEKVEIQKSRLVYDRRAKISSVSVALTNVYPNILIAPVKVVVNSISSEDVTVANADGTTIDGKPYFEYGALDPGILSSAKKFAFNNPLRRRFSYELIVFDATSQTIVITGKAIAGLPVVGTINLKDSSNPVKIIFSAIEYDGSYTLDIDPHWTPPFMMWAEGWVNNKHLRLLSCFDLEQGETQININTTPITTAIVESAMGKTASEIAPESEPVPDQNEVNKIRQAVEQSLTNLFAVIGIPSGFNLFETPIEEVGSPTDQLFDTIGVKSDDQGNIIFTDFEGEEFVIDPDDPPGNVPQEIIDNVVHTGDALDQTNLILSDFFNLFGDQDNLPDRIKLEAELVPDLAAGFLHRGEGISDWIDRLTLTPSQVAPNEEFVGCTIFRPMITQYYGNIPVEEMPDNYDSGLWVLVTTNINGKAMPWLTSFVDIGNNTWKWYGNRIPFRRFERCRPRGRLIKYPAGSVIYSSGLQLWHNDVGNLAWNMGIRTLAIFNSAFAPENINGVNTNCVRLERREEGLDTRFRLKDVPTWWHNDSLYQLSKENGDRLIDFDILKIQEPIEMVVVGLDDAENPVRTWIYTIPEPPNPVNELEADPEQFFATIEQDTISFQEYDANDPDNPDAFPGNGGQFSWIYPKNTNLFPSWSELGWDDMDWNWNNLQIDNPAWYSPGDFYAWASDIYQPGPNAISPRMASFTITMRDANLKHYKTDKRWDPWSENFINIENDHLVFDVSHSWSQDNLDPNWGSITARTRIRGRHLNRFEAPFVVENATTNGNAYAEASIRLSYQPPEDYNNGDKNIIRVGARIRYQGGQLYLQGFVWGSRNADGTDEISPAPSSGNYPYGQVLSFNQTYNLAVEYIETSNQFMIEFDDGSPGAPYKSFYDMSSIPNFNFDPDNLIHAEIHTRVRSLEHAGDTGSIRVRIDNTKVDGISFDEFIGGFANNKWDVRSYE